MPDVHIDLRLRPVRIGLLVRPSDRKSILAFMRACACVWGGMYNPIIPVFRTFPKDWKPEAYERYQAADISKGYIRFFEPDVYVEAAQGLLEEAGLASLRKDWALEPRVIKLEQFIAPQEHRDRFEALFGLDIINVISDLYKSEHQFKKKDESPAYLVRPDKVDGLVEAVFGRYPDDAPAAYIKQSFASAFASIEVESGPETWKKVFKTPATVPLYLTQHGLKRTRFWHHRPVIYVFDPTRSTDLIDVWNLRLEPSPFLPVPIQWADALMAEFREIVTAEYRPVRGNPYDLMHCATIEFGRSISQPDADKITTSVQDGLAPGVSFSVKNWRNRVWAAPGDGVRPRAELMKITAQERTSVVTMRTEADAIVRFDTLAPAFAEQYGRASVRWVNAASVSIYGPHSFATVLPFNTFDKSWPRIGATNDVPNIGPEGWVFDQKYKNIGEAINFLTPEIAITQFLKLRGIQATLSEPGQIAKQMIDQLGDLMHISLLADAETLDLLNNMAGGLRRKSNDQDEVEETFEGRRAPVKKWIDLIARRQQQGLFARARLEEFTKKNIIRLGVISRCPHCQFENWHGLNNVDYTISCERCVKAYDFPQAHLSPRNENWEYRVVGPFSVPDYGRGSYPSLLALRVLHQFSTSHARMTFATAMKLEFDGLRVEVDFIGWHTKEALGRDRDKDPQLVIGETKSKGQGDLVKQRDLDQLKIVGERLPGSVIVIAVMRNEFTKTEIKRLEKFVIWASRSDQFGNETNPVLLLTGHELFADHGVHGAWEALGGAYKSHSDFHNLDGLYAFARSTRAIHVPNALKAIEANRQKAFKRESHRRRAS
jgi:hypothetical protein